MRRTFSLVWTIILIVTASALLPGQTKPRPAAVNRAQIDRTIRALEIEWWRAAGRKNVDQFVAYYHDDAELNPPGAPQARGKAAIRKVVEGLLLTPGVSISGQTASVMVAEAGDLVVETGTYELAQTDKAGKIARTPGKYVVIWKKDSLGRWKAAVDIFNADK